MLLRFALVCLLLFVMAGQAMRAAALEEGEEPPATGQPDHFTGAIGTSYQVTLHANPSEVRVGEPFTLTVRVVATGPWRRPPNRPKLDDLNSFKGRFRFDRIERGKVNRPDREMPTPRPDWTIDHRLRPPHPLCIREVPPEQRTWEFDYRLRPLVESIDEIPAVPFAYYRPSRNPPLPGSFPTAFADPIPFKVLPKEVAKAPAVKIEAPAGFLTVVRGPQVAGQSGLFRLPVLPLVLLILLIPPLACFGCYVAWQRFFPDAARLARRRQSRAARAALQELRKVKGTSLEQARRVVEITAEYLRHRFGLPGLEPTPAEVGQFLRKQGAKPELADRAAALFQTCDTIRFAPEPPAGTELTAAASELILDLEMGGTP